MPAIILDLVVNRVDLVDEGANSEAFIKLYKRKESDPVMNFDEILAKMKPEHADVIRAEISKAKAGAPAEVTATELAKAKQDLQTATEELQVMKQKEAETIAKAKGELSFEDIIKNADPAVQEVLKSINAQKVAAETAVRELNNKAKHDEAVIKAKDLKALPVEEAALVEVLKSITPEVHEILKAAAKAVEESGMFQEVGKSKDNGSLAGGNGNAAWSKIEKKAGEIATRDTITHEAAVAKAIKEFPELYKEYVDGGAN